MGADENDSALHAALGIVRGVGALLSVEILNWRGGGVTVDAPAVFTAVYAPGDRVLVLFQSSDLDSAVVAGRVGVPADAPSGAALLALLLGSDGAGSGLDADLLDGQHEAALLRANGSRALTADWDIGSGRAMKAAALQARAADGLTLTDDSGGLGLCVADGGNVGVGTTTPQGRLHVREAVGGFLFASRTAIGATAQVLIADGAGDVTSILRVEAVVSNGVAANLSMFTLTLGGAMAQGTTVGSDTFQFRLNADGSFDVRRTVGSNPGTAVVRAMWG